MKFYRLRSAMIIGLLCLTFGLVLAQDAIQEPAQLPAVDMPLPSPMQTALIPCTADSTGPCDMIATSPDDIVGVWKQYFLDKIWNAPSGVAYIRYFADGHYNIADTVENTLEPYKNYPTGTYRFEDGQLIIDADPNAPPPFNTAAIWQARVLKYGNEPVAMRYVAIKDDNYVRVLDITQALLWVGE